MNTVRIWDLPTRLFHWALAACVVALVITAKVGGDAMNWHIRLGYAVFVLLLFRLMWGLVGGRWSRFASFVPTPGRLMRYLRGQAPAHETAGHSALGALSVFALLVVLAAQVGTGLFADDEIAFTGPLVGWVSGSVVSAATRYHKSIGQGLLIGLVVLHLVAIAVYWWRGKNLVRPMIAGDKQMPATERVAPSADGAGQRLLALVLLALATTCVYVLIQSAESPVAVSHPEDSAQPVARTWYSRDTNNVECIETVSPGELARTIQDSGQLPKMSDLPNGSVKVEVERNGTYYSWTFYPSFALCKSTLPRAQKIDEKYN